VIFYEWAPAEFQLGEGTVGEVPGERCSSSQKTTSTGYLNRDFVEVLYTYR
jgi:hypothetical protein